MHKQTIALIGGTGFVGGHIVSKLARQRANIRVLTRRREKHRGLLVCPTLKLVEVDVHDAGALAAELTGCDAVINLAGILNESELGDFERVHAALPRTIAEACHASGVKRLLHMSALNASTAAPSEYLRSKARGEEAVRAWLDQGVGVTSFAPSVIFGPGDSFFNRFATLLRLSVGFFPLACAEARFAPVYVGDVVDAFTAALDDAETVGERYELCGPRRYTLAELVEYTAEVIGKRCRVYALSERLSELQAQVLERVPGKPFSLDNYASMKVDSVCSDKGLARLGIDPTGLEGLVPSYLGNRNRAGRYQRFRSATRR